MSMCLGLQIITIFGLVGRNWAYTPIEQICIDQERDFVNFCSNLHGLTDGGRCFFVHSTAPVTWEGAWKNCMQMDATLPHIHTESEARLLRTLMESPAVQAIPSVEQRQRGYIALYDNETRNPLSTVTPKTNWCDDPECVAQLPAMKTMARAPSRSSVAQFLKNKNPKLQPKIPRCFSLNGDDICTNGFTICQITNKFQNYKQSGKCMKEEVYGVADVRSLADLQQCAQWCAETTYCHSFNMAKSRYDSLNMAKSFDDGWQCQLFTWSAYDAQQLKIKMSPASATCAHYNYVP